MSFQILNFIKFEIPALAARGESFSHLPHLPSSLDEPALIRLQFHQPRGFEQCVPAQIGRDFMTTMNVKLPDSLVKQAQEMAEKEEVTLDQLVSSALAEKVAAWKTVGYLQARAARGDREKFEKAMSKVPVLEPDERDRL